MDCSDAAAPVWARYDKAAACWLLQLHVQPGAKQSAVTGLHGDRLKLKIAAPAVDNKANAQLISWLAGQLGIPKSAVTLLRGDSARLKTVAVRGIEAPWQLLEKSIK